MDDEIKLLDHGYLRFVESWGSDEQIIRSARMSTAKGFLGWGPPDACLVCNGTGKTEYQDEFLDFVTDSCKSCKGDGKKPGDEKLLKFLWDHAHHTPFEMAGITIEAKAPIFVCREWQRHRVPFGYNEMSSRYVPLPDENYRPDPHDIVLRSKVGTKTSNRQNSGAREAHPAEVANWLARLDEAYSFAQSVYEDGLYIGVPKELARVIVPVGRYSVMRVTSNLRGWLGFIKLRSAPNAQWEIREYSNALAEIIRAKFPRTYTVARESMGLP